MCDEIVGSIQKVAANQYSCRFGTTMFVDTAISNCKARVKRSLPSATFVDSDGPAGKSVWIVTPIANAIITDNGICITTDSGIPLVTDQGAP